MKLGLYRMKFRLQHIKPPIVVNDDEILTYKGAIDGILTGKHILTKNEIK